MTIDLGRKLDSMPVPCCPPSEAGDRVIYPSLYIQGGKELGQLPDRGTVTLRYRTVRKSQIEDRNGKSPRIELELEALEIVNASKKGPEKGEDALEALKEKVGASDSADENDDADDTY